jgi:hypothetical protein
VRFEEDINGRTVIVRQAQNLSTSTSYGTELVTTFNAGDRLEGTISGNLYRSVTDGSNVTTDLSQDALLFSGRGSVRAKLRDGLQLELSQFYRPARDIPPQAGSIGLPAPSWPSSRSCSGATAPSPSGSTTFSTTRT